MKTVISKNSAILALMLTPMLAAAQDATGIWRTEATDRGYLEIEISPCADGLCGEIIRARNAEGVSGPYEHLGSMMITGMTPDAEAGSWSGGTIWDPRNDRSFNSRMTLEDARTLKVAGCVLGICQSQLWRRVE